MVVVAFDVSLDVVFEPASMLVFDELVVCDEVGEVAVAFVAVLTSLNRKKYAPVAVTATIAKAPMIFGVAE